MRAGRASGQARLITLRISINCTALHWTALHYTVLYCTALKLAVRTVCKFSGPKRVLVRRRRLRPAMSPYPRPGPLFAAAPPFPQFFARAKRSSAACARISQFELSKIPNFENRIIYVLIPNFQILQISSNV